MIRIRDLEPRDSEFLRQMLHEALFWDPDRERLPPEFVLAHPQVTIFHEGWGRPGDTALVAEYDGEPVGVVWYRLFTEESHGEGFVDERTPELAIAVVPSARGKGVGSALLEALLARAREAGHEAISLSVDRNNAGAIRLYEQHGFQRVAETDDSVTMLARLT